jgi:hypothetical protein
MEAARFLKKQKSAQHGRGQRPAKRRRDCGGSLAGVSDAPQAPPDRPRLRDRQGPPGLHRGYRRVGGRPHLRNARRSLLSAKQLSFAVIRLMALIKIADLINIADLIALAPRRASMVVASLSQRVNGTGIPRRQFTAKAIRLRSRVAFRFQPGRFPPEISGERLRLYSY